jgi:endonuclease/exonuclease/phosphatase family metal-dependent hydrolase
MIISRRGLLILALLLALPGLASAREPSSVGLRAMTYNIRLNLASDGENDWPHRKEMVAAVIRREAPDLLGMQEVLLVQKRDLEAQLPEFQMVGVARGDGRGKGEFSPLAFRRDRFELVDSGTIWLSDTPTQPSKAWDAAFPRIATWALLRDRRSRQSLRVLNTHFDHIGVVARHQSAALLLAWLKQGAWSSLPTILMGDLNSPPEGSAYRQFADTGTSGLGDARLVSRTPPYGPPGTFNAFNIASDAAAPIDHIFVSGQFRVESYSVITQHWGGRLPSDHYPVIVELAPEAAQASRP